MVKRLLPVLFLFFLQIHVLAGEFFWVGGTGNWTDPNHWSATSGGIGGAGVPNGRDIVHFDSLSFSQNDQVVTLPEGLNFDNFRVEKLRFKPKLVFESRNK